MNISGPRSKIKITNKESSRNKLGSSLKRYIFSDVGHKNKKKIRRTV